MYAVGDAHGHLSLGEDGGRRGGSLAYTRWEMLSEIGPTAGWGEVDLSHVRHLGCSLTNVPSGGWERRGGSLACMQWGMLTDKCP